MKNNNDHDDDILFTQLCEAIKDANVREVNRLLKEEKIHPEKKDARERPFALAFNKVVPYCFDRASTKIVHLLLEHGADPNLLIRGDTPLYRAAKADVYEIVKALLVAGADPSIDNPRRIAQEKGNYDTANLLRIYDRAQIPFIRYMEALGYQINYDGMCHGFANMAKQAILADDMPTFNRRYLNIHDIVGKAELKAARQLNLSGVEYSKLTEEKKKEFEARIQEILKEKLKKIRDQDIDVFYDGVAVYQDQCTESFSYLYRNQRQITMHQLDARAFDLVKPVKLAKEGTARIESVTGVYETLQDMQDFITCLRQAMETKTLNKPVAMILSCAYHSITIGYHPGEKTWLFFDSNKPPMIKVKDDTRMAVKIRTAFKSASVCMATTISASKVDEAKMQHCISDIKKNPVWKKLHCATPRKANLKNADGSTWDKLALKYGDVHAFKELHHKEDFFKRHWVTTALSIGAGVSLCLAAAASSLFLGPMAAAILLAGAAVSAGLIIAECMVSGLVEDYREVREVKKRYIHFDNQLGQAKPPISSTHQVLASVSIQAVCPEAERAKMNDRKVNLPVSSNPHAFHRSAVPSDVPQEDNTNIYVNKFRLS